MNGRSLTVLIMAAGTGGHVFPALAIAEALRKKSATVEWLGTPSGMENDLLNSTDIPLHQISVSGLRGSGLVRKLLAPFMLIGAFIQSIRVFHLVKPDCVLGMGGFICGPAGLATKLVRIPLVIHEQNAVAGLTNRLLSRFATRVLEAFPGTFKPGIKSLLTGNPLRSGIAQLELKDADHIREKRSLNILVLGGSQGAEAINNTVPKMLAMLSASQVNVLHQTGKNKMEDTSKSYQAAGLTNSDCYKIDEFIEDMPQAYDWADVVICRSGASTVSEIAAAGKAAILIPYPFHKDNQQTLNANWLVNEQAAFVIQQADLSASSLLTLVKGLFEDREKLILMNQRANELAIRNAAEVIADECIRIAHA